MRLLSRPSKEDAVEVFATLRANRTRGCGAGTQSVEGYTLSAISASHQTIAESSVTITGMPIAPGSLAASKSTADKSPKTMKIREMVLKSHTLALCVEEALADFLTSAVTSFMVQHSISETRASQGYPECQ